MFDLFHVVQVDGTTPVCSEKVGAEAVHVINQATAHRVLFSLGRHDVEVYVVAVQVEAGRVLGKRVKIVACTTQVSSVVSTAICTDLLRDYQSVLWQFVS